MSTSSSPSKSPASAVGGGGGGCGCGGGLVGEGGGVSERKPRGLRCRGGIAALVVAERAVGIGVAALLLLDAAPRLGAGFFPARAALLFAAALDL